MTGFALYRLPHQTQVTMVAQRDGMPSELTNLTALSGQQGFVMAPFSIADAHPLLLIRPDVMASCHQSQVSELRVDDSWEWDRWLENAAAPQCGAPSRDDYSTDFARFHQPLVEGVFRKIVLSRSAVMPRQDSDPLRLYQQACERYPRLFVTLVYTPQSGLWLTATPEILLEGNGKDWRTIALAGTMRLTGEQMDGEGEQLTWSTKNIQEQHYVATYLKERLMQFADDVDEEGPKTVRAANLVHLRSDFTFTLSDENHLGQLLQTLHPTPAVCGLPKEKAFRFILENEHTPRLYYSGFMGPLNLQSGDSCQQSQTHLYVSLRCMQIMHDHYRLYAGGGLLKDSQEEMEWQETEAKMETMKEVIVHTSID